MTNLDAPIDSLKGIGAKTKQTFEKAGIETLEDLIHYYPREYERYEAPVPVMELKEGMYAAVSGHLLAPADAVCKRSVDHLRAVRRWAGKHPCELV